MIQVIAYPTTPIPSIRSCELHGRTMMDSLHQFSDFYFSSPSPKPHVLLPTLLNSSRFIFSIHAILEQQHKGFLPTQLIHSTLFS
ncbi:hypothetical protein RJT34_14967 [Clitoria ternatea]|uniref:Uncharacterized protein n=1 Tax=Clitoria ternatea TaxID=43366 RepID=A0AAN9JUT1_CLITE